MGEIIIKLPQTVKNAFESVAELIRILQPFFEVTDRDVIILDFRNLYWYDANLLPVLGVCIEEKVSYCDIKFFREIRDKIKKLWGKNNFGKYFELPEYDDIYNSTIQYKVFHKEDGKVFGEYVEEELLNNPAFPNMTSLLKKQISLNIQEIFGNAPMHGNCNKVVCCGQHFYQQHKLSFTIVNLGTTIQENVNNFFRMYRREEPPESAISWAIIEDNSTKGMTNGKSGGKGLAYLHEFISKNKGSMYIFSGNEFYIKEKNIEEASKSYSLFPGTIVTIQINLNDVTIYDCNDEYIYDDFDLF